MEMTNTTAAPCTPGEKLPKEPDWKQYVEFFELLEADIPEPLPSWEVGIKIFICVISMAVGITGNMAVLVVIFFNKNMRTSTNVYIANLAFSDLMVCMWCMWIHVGADIISGHSQWPFGEFFCKFYPFLLGNELAC